MYLAGQGADVVKVEPPEGDIGRTITMSAPVKGLSRAFWSLNRNKRGISIDLKRPEGQDLVRRLAAESDVLIHNFRPGVDRRLGIDYEPLAEQNPGLVYVAFNAFGPRGPRRGARGYDLLIQAASGISMRRTDPDGRPRPVGIFAVDMASSIMAGYAIALALFERERTGRGKKIEGSLLQTALALQVPDLVRVTEFPEPPIDTSLEAPAVFGQYRCADGQYVQIAVASNAEWRSLCAAIGRADLGKEPRYGTSASRIERSSELRPLLAAVFSERGSAEWQSRFDEHDAPAGTVETPESVFDSAQARANGAFVELEQPDIGHTTMVGVSFHQSDRAPPAFSPAPHLGEHTGSVLRELGLGEEEIARLKADRVVR